MCATCPVQTDSACTKPKIAAEMTWWKILEDDAEDDESRNDEECGNDEEHEPRQMMSMSKEQMQAMSDEMTKNTPKDQTNSLAPKPDDLPGPYCAIGVSVCKDLDFSKICMCSGCSVFKNFNLAKAKPMNYFCKDGKPTWLRLHSMLNFLHGAHLALWTAPFSLLKPSKQDTSEWIHTLFQML